MPLTFNDVKAEIASAVNGDYRAGVLLGRLRTKGAGYKDAHAYAVRVGEVTGRVLKKYQPEDLSEWDLDDLIPGTLGLNHSMVASACKEAQKNLNAKAQIGIRPQEPEFDGNRAFGLVAAVKERGEIGPAFYDQVTNFDQNVVDESIRENADIQSDSGLHPKIIRTAEANCCAWCDALAGTYDYDDVSDTGNEVWQRHDNCRCTIEYDPGKRDGWKRHVSGPRSTDSRKADRIAFAEGQTQTGAQSGAKKTEEQQKAHAKTYYEEIRNRKPYADARIIIERVEGFTVNEIEDIRQHMFIREIKRDGTVKRLDADWDQAQVWQRLTTGQPLWDTDQLMLEHERMESRIMRETGCTYEEAHDQTQKVFDWWSAYLEEKARRGK